MTRKQFRRLRVALKMADAYLRSEDRGQPSGYYRLNAAMLRAAQRMGVNPDLRAVARVEGWY